MFPSVSNCRTMTIRVDCIHPTNVDGFGGYRKRSIELSIVDHSYGMGRDESGSVDS